MFPNRRRAWGEGELSEPVIALRPSAGTARERRRVQTMGEDDTLLSLSPSSSHLVWTRVVTWTASEPPPADALGERATAVAPKMVQRPSWYCQPQRGGLVFTHWQKSSKFHLECGMSSFKVSRACGWAGIETCFVTFARISTLFTSRKQCLSLQPLHDNFCYSRYNHFHHEI